MKGINSTDPLRKNNTDGMTLIPRNKMYHYQANGTEQEPLHDFNFTSKDLQYPWEQYP